MREIKHLSIHPWLRSAILDSQQPTSPIGFLFLKLPPPPCAVLLGIAVKFSMSFCWWCFWSRYFCLWYGIVFMTWRYGDTAQRCLFGIWSHGGGFPSCNPVLSTCSTHLSKLEFAFKIICYRSCFDIWNKYTRQEQKRLPANVWRWSSASRIFEIYVELGWIGAWNGSFLKWWIPKNE